MKMKIRGTDVEMEVSQLWVTFFSGGFISYVGLSLVLLSNSPEKTSGLISFILSSSAFIGGGLMVYGAVVIIGDIIESKTFKEFQDKVNHNAKRIFKHDRN